MSRSVQAAALVAQSGGELPKEFVLHVPPFRYLAIETDETGIVVQAQQADSLGEIAKLLESSEIQCTDTEIYDLDTGDVLRPDFERTYRVPRIYLKDVVVYRSSDEVERSKAAGS